MSKINLIPEVKVEQIKLKKLNVTAVLSAIAVTAIMVFFSFIMLGYNFVLGQGIKNTESDINATKQEINQYTEIEEMVLNLNDGLVLVENLKASNHKWSYFLNHLEKITPSDIRFLQFAQEGSKITAKAEGKQVSAIGRLVKSIEDYESSIDLAQASSDKEENLKTKIFQNTQVNGYNRNTDGTVEFTIIFELIEGLIW